jgi:hypothetical protein
MRTGRVQAIHETVEKSEAVSRRFGSKKCRNTLVPKHINCAGRKAHFIPKIIQAMGQY